MALIVPKWPLRVNQTAASVFCYPKEILPFSSKTTPGHPVRLARRFRHDTPSSSPKTAHFDNDGLRTSNMNKPLPQVFHESLGSDVFKTRSVVGGPITPQLAATQRFTSYVSWPGTLFVDKTRYIELLDQSGVYSNMFLRPRRFGKSTFLNMLCEYYDIAAAAKFDDIFGGLYISKNPTEFRSRHLVLKLDLSSIETGDINLLRASFNRYMNTILAAFLDKYRSNLDEFKPADILCLEDGSSSLRQTLMLVKKSKHTMFVGIDEYDAPVNSVVFVGSSYETNLIRITKVNAIEDFFKMNLFSNFKEAVGDGPTGCVSKYFLTGVLPAFRSGISPLTATNIISESPKYHGICGFTEKQVETITRAYLDQGSGDPNSKDSGSQDQSSLEQVISGACWAMKRYYNGYSFTTLGNEERLYNPLLVHYYLSMIKQGEVVANPEQSPTVHTVNLLKLIADTGRFSSDDIIELMMAGSLPVTGGVQNEFGFIDVMQQVGKDRSATLSLLFHLGILTHAGKVGQPYQLRIPNEVMKMNVLSRIHNYISAQQQIKNQIAPANRSLRNGSVKLFAKLLGDFLATLRSSNEAVLQGVVEILLDPPRTRVPELYLVMDGKKQKGDGRYAFPDIFVVGNDNSESAVVLELKDIHLSGLWNGAHGGWAKWTIPSYEELEALAEKVAVMDEASMDKMRYMYWSDRDNKYTSTTIGKMRKDALAQVKRYVKVIKKGRAEKFEDSGVRDPRVTVKRTDSTLFSFVLMAVGGQRILYEAGKPEKMKFSYSSTLA